MITIKTIDSVNNNIDNRLIFCLNPCVLQSIRLKFEKLGKFRSLYTDIIS